MASFVAFYVDGEVTTLWDDAISGPRLGQVVAVLRRHDRDRSTKNLQSQCRHSLILFTRSSSKMTTETQRNAVEVEPLHLENARTWRGKAFPIGFQVKSAGDQTTPVTVEDGVQYLQDLSASGELTRLLREHGAVLFRGFGSPSAETFSKLVNAAERARNNTPYEQVGLAGKRSIQAPEVFTANEGPETQRFFLHNEVSKHF